MTDQTKQAIQYLAAAVSDYANTMPASVRGPFSRECQVAIRQIEESLTQPDLAPVPATVAP